MTRDAKLFEGERDDSDEESLEVFWNWSEDEIIETATHAREARESELDNGIGQR